MVSLIVYAFLQFSDEISYFDDKERWITILVTRHIIKQENQIVADG